MILSKHFLHSCILSHTVTYLGSHGGAKGGQRGAKGAKGRPKGGQRGGQRGAKLSHPLVTMLLCRGAYVT